MSSTLEALRTKRKFKVSPRGKISRDEHSFDQGILSSEERENKPTSKAYGSNNFALLVLPIGIAVLFLSFNFSHSGKNFKAKPSTISSKLTTSSKSKQCQRKSFDMPDIAAIEKNSNVANEFHFDQRLANTTKIAWHAATQRFGIFDHELQQKRASDELDCRNPLAAFFNRDCRHDMRKKNSAPPLRVNETLKVEPPVLLDVDCNILSRKCRKRKRLVAQMLAMAKKGQNA